MPVLLWSLVISGSYLEHLPKNFATPIFVFYHHDTPVPSISLQVHSHKLEKKATLEKPSSTILERATAFKV